MTGPEHYLEAERLLAAVEQPTSDGRAWQSGERSGLVHKAVAHAALALCADLTAAATDICARLALGKETPR